MIRRIPQIAIATAAVVSLVRPVSAATEYRLGIDGNPWEVTLSLEGAGSYVVFDVDGQEVRRVPVGTTPHGAGTDTLIDFSDESIAPRYIDQDVNLALADLDSNPTKIPLPYTGGEAQTNARCIEIGQDHKIAKVMFDGDPKTAMFRAFTQDATLPIGCGDGWGSICQKHSDGTLRFEPRSAIVDFSAAVPVNRIRFYPRLGRNDDLALLDDFREPKPSLEAFGEDSFAGNFLAWYDIQVGDNTPKFRKGICDAVGIINGLPWVLPTDPQLELIAGTRENLDVVVDLRFPTRSIRWINLRPWPLRNWEIAEIEIYGEGYVEETVLLTQIMDFGKPINWGSLRWVGEQPAGTRVEIRTRTGHTADPNLYFARNTNGDLERISLADYNKIDVSGRLAPELDDENWSFWSAPYDFEQGLRDQSEPAGAWRDGTAMLSPGPSRYIQLYIKLFSTFTAAPRLEQFALQLAEAASAQEIVGEIWPIEAPSFEPTTFSYVVRPVFEAGNAGFDRLEILTTSRVDTVRSVVINEDEVDLDEFPPLILSDRLVVGFPLLVNEEDSFKRIQVTFDATVLRFGSEFLGWVFNSADEDGVKQRIEPGNATFRFSGNVLAVSTPLGGKLLLQVEAVPAVMTPNGDGINEVVRISYKLRQLTSARPVSLRLFDLSGRQVHELPVARVSSGAFQFVWDGRAGANQLVPPGTYIYELSLDAGKNERATGTISVAY